jgi:hypothetical protein
LMKTDFFMSSDQFFYDNKYWTEHKSTLPHWLPEIPTDSSSYQHGMKGIIYRHVEKCVCTEFRSENLKATKLSEGKVTG